MAPLSSPEASPGPASTNTEERLRLLIETGLTLASQRSLAVIVQTALDAGLRLCGASFGAFFHNNIGEEGEIFQLYKASADDPSALAASRPPQPNDPFVAIFLAPGAPYCGKQRFDDLTQLPPLRNAALNPSALQFPGVHPGVGPVRSFLAVPVRSASGEALGALFYGHIRSGVFDSGCEDIVATVASQAAVAIDNACLADTLSQEIALTEAARSLQRETADRLRQALEAAQLGTWTWNRSTDLLDLDERAAELLHVEPHVPVSRNALRQSIVISEDRDVTMDSLQRSMDSGGLYAAEYRVSSGSDRQTWISARGVATFSPGLPDITGMIGTLQDITERKNGDAALRQSEKIAAAGRLAATIAHEINNPLEAVTNLIYLSKTDQSVPESVKLLLDTADHELARVAQIAQQTLGFYRESGRPVEVDLNDLIQRCVDLFARRMQSRHIVCTLDLAPDLRIFGFPGEIRQVMSNLLVNAIDASPGSSAIHIRARRRAFRKMEGVTLLIADRGVGIPAHARARLFSPFFTTKESVGTGLGLWVTRGIVEKQGGVISFRSRTEPPSGTVFRLFLRKVGQVSPGEQTNLSLAH